MIYFIKCLCFILVNFPKCFLTDFSLYHETCNGQCFSHGVCGEKENWYSPTWMKQKRCSTCECETTEFVEGMVSIQLILLAGVSLSVFASGFLFPWKAGIWYRAHFGKLRCCLILIDRVWYIGVMVANALAFFMWAYVFLAPDYTCCFKIIDSEDADFCIRGKIYAVFIFIH